jgi:Siphovirus Gp157
MTAPATLYQIEDDLLAALDTIEIVGDDGPAKAELEEHIARLIAAEITKVDGISRMLAHFEDQAELAAKEIKRLQDRKRTFERSYERLESCAKFAMEVAGKTKLEGTTSTLTLHKSPASVFVYNFDQVPAEYFTVKIERWVDKEKVKRAFKAGIEVPGAELVEDRFHLVRR